VLAQRGIETGGGSAPVAAATPNAAVHTISAGTSAIGTTDLTGRQVITQKDLAALSNTTITVAKRSVISPLALDFAREKQILINRIDPSPQSTGSAAGPSATVAVAVSPDALADINTVNALCASKGMQVRKISENSYEQAVKSLAAAVASGAAQFGVCIEKSGIEGPIFANRNDNVRAVHCRTVAEARAARVEYQANVLVIGAGSDPRAVAAAFCGLE
jgi:ribose 5-phosphate isomerase RpiB